MSPAVLAQSCRLSLRALGTCSGSTTARLMRTPRLRLTPSQTPSSVTVTKATSYPVGSVATRGTGGCPASRRTMATRGGKHTAVPKASSGSSQQPTAQQKQEEDDDDSGSFEFKQLTPDSSTSAMAVEDAKSDSTARSALDVAGLVAGDYAALLVFALIGRMSHGESAAGALLTALPFFIGVAGAGALATQGFGDKARGDDPIAALGVAAKTWAIGVPVGLVLRSLAITHRAPPVSFCAVTLATTFVLFVGWRVGRAVWVAEKTDERRRRLAKRATSDRKGDVGDLFKMIRGLTSRW